MWHRGLYQDIAILLPTHAEGWEIVTCFEQDNVKVNHVFEKTDRPSYHKKIFWMGADGIKACTIHSFKGWEVRNVILVTPSDNHPIADEKLDYVLYTAITRARENLIVLNRHPKYQAFGAGWKG